MVLNQMTRFYEILLVSIVVNEFNEVLIHTNE